MQYLTRAVLSHNLRYYRRLHGWSQEQLADHCGLHRTYVGAIERGERNVGLDNLERLAAALQVSVPALLIDLQGSRQPDGVRETAAVYRSRRPRRRTALPFGFLPRVAAYSHQYATHSLSTHFPNLLVMSPHESKCKEASGTPGTTAAHQPRLVAGGAR